MEKLSYRTRCEISTFGGRKFLLQYSIIALKGEVWRQKPKINCCIICKIVNVHKNCKVAKLKQLKKIVSIVKLHFNLSSHSTARRFQMGQTDKVRHYWLCCLHTIEFSFSNFCLNFLNLSIWFCKIPSMNTKISCHINSFVLPADIDSYLTVSDIGKI